MLDFKALFGLRNVVEMKVCEKLNCFDWQKDCDK